MEYITIGKVANAHGVRGDLKIFPMTDNLKRYELLDKVFIENKGKIETLNVTNVKYVKNLVIISTKEIKDMNEALTYKNASILITEDELLPLEENENYIFELIGLMAMDMDGNELGKLKDVLSTGAHDVYVIDDGSKHGLMIPATMEFVPEVNVEEGYIKVKLIEGLRGL